MVRVGNDLVIIGGFLDGVGDGISKLLYKLSCNNNFCECKQMAQTMKFERMDFVAVGLPDHFLTCDTSS